jgi:LPXTG-motif cell wall-anchored protein
MKFTNRYKKILIVCFLVLTLISALSIAWFLTNNKKSTDTRSSASVDSTTIKVFFESTALNSQVNGEVQVNVLVESIQATKVSAMTLPLTFSPEYFEFDQTATKDSTKQANTSCRNQNFKLDNTVTATADAQGGLKITKVSLGSDADLPSGRFCFGTITFKAKKAGNSSVAIKSISDPNWEIVGPSGTYSPALVVGTTSSTVTIAGTATVPTATALPIPTRLGGVNSTSTPTPSPTGQVCAQVIRYAYNPANPTDCRTLANSCVQVPQGFVVVSSCSQTTTTATPTTAIVPKGATATPQALPETGLVEKGAKLAILGMASFSISLLLFRRIKPKKDLLERIIQD